MVRVIVLKTGLLECHAYCKFSRMCANHITAGDFRIYDGFTPELKKQALGWTCITQFRTPCQCHPGLPIMDEYSIGALCEDGSICSDC